jgi:hypothetical protein
LLFTEQIDTGSHSPVPTARVPACGCEANGVGRFVGAPRPDPDPQPTPSQPPASIRSGPFEILEPLIPALSRTQHLERGSTEGTHGNRSAEVTSNAAPRTRLRRPAKAVRSPIRRLISRASSRRLGASARKLGSAESDPCGTVPFGRILNERSEVPPSGQIQSNGPRGQRLFREDSASRGCCLAL